MHPDSQIVVFPREGHDLHVEVVGSGTPVVLAHGMSGSGRRDWTGLVEALAPTFRCIVPDMRGHAKSSYRPGGISYSGMAGDIVALVEAIGPSPAHLVGFSMGGEVVLEVARHRGDLARSLVLVAPCLGRGSDYPHQIEPELVLPRNWPASLRTPHQRHGADHWKTILQDVSADWMRRPELKPEEVSHISAPVLAVIGDQEEPYKHRQAAVLARAVTHTELVILPGGHAVHLDSSATFEDRTLEFLLQADRAAGDGR